MANETITGKIFTLKDPTGTYNRFPRTVMEAVYGLNTYLQNQFSSLADIYMPIEGISESKTGQEFVYRKSAATIKAKSLTLDRIYGKTLAWNNIESGSSSGTCTYDSTTRIYTCTGAGYAEAGVGSTSFIAGHKYYLLLNVLKDSGGKTLRDFTVHADGNSMLGVKITGLNGVGSYSTVGTSTNSGVLHALMEYRGSGTIDAQFKYELVDLTLMFGAGNEPSTVAEFEALYPGYHDYCAGKLISNDAASVETVGFNLWDEEWEAGRYDTNTGNKAPDSGTIRSKNYIPVFPSTVYFLQLSANESAISIKTYDANKNYLGAISTMYASTVNRIFETGSSVRFITFNTNSAYGTIYNHDICINLSDESKNGQYEPYKKSTMPLNLDSIKVYSHNIWDEEWELGTYGTSSGAKVDSDSVIRSVNAIPCQPETSYYVKSPSGTTVVAYFYDENENYLSYHDYSANSTFSTPANCKFIRFRMSSEYGTTYNHDICINVSDSAFNGQYDPYGDNGIITIDGGLKGAGTAYDEIVGNKMVKRIGRVDLGTLNYDKFNYSESLVLYTTSIQNRKTGDKQLKCAKYIVSTHAWDALDDKELIGRSGYDTLYIRDDSYSDAATFKAAMSGVYMDYELATPIEYELAEPIVPTVKAGTTEARVSPNVDGLSAPMVCDMTYDANANNDSANSQYAATAGRLMNSHNLWGQAFDGTQDVTGALTGVTSIAMNGELSGVTTLGASGAVTLGSTLSVTGNTTIGGTLGVTGALTANGAASINNTLGVTGATTLSSTLNVTGNTTLSGTLTVGSSQTNKATTLNGTLTATGAATLGSTLTVTGLTSIAGGLKLTTTKKIWFDDTHYLELLTENGTQYLHTNLNVVSNAGVVAGATANS